MEIDVSDYAAYRLTHQAEELTRQVPWLFDQILEMLQAHQSQWQQRVEDMKHLANSPMATEQLVQIGLQSISQIRTSGELLHKRIQAVITKAIVTHEGKPKSNQWSPQQTREGHEKRELLTAALILTNGL